MPNLPSVKKTLAGSTGELAFFSVLENNGTSSDRRVWTVPIDWAICDLICSQHGAQNSDCIDCKGTNAMLANTTFEFTLSDRLPDPFAPLR